MGTDRRILYTKMVIREALDKLLAKSTLEQITIKEICAEAGINRATFYRNYEDIYDLFGSIEKKLIKEAFPEGLTNGNRDKLLHVIYENQSFYKEFFRSRTETPYIRQVIEEMGETMRGLVSMGTRIDEKQFLFSYRYTLHGILGMLKDWVDGGCTQTPDEFGKMLFDIVDRQYGQ